MAVWVCGSLVVVIVLVLALALCRSAGTMDNRLGYK